MYIINIEKAAIRSS